MSILTKIFVVLVTVLSVATATLIVAFVTNVQNYKDRSDQLETQKAIAEQRADRAQADAQRDLNAKNDELAQLSGQIADLRQQINTLTLQRDQLQTDLVDARRMNDDIGERLEQLASASEQMTAINEMLQNEVRRLRDERLTLQTRNIELTAEVREKSLTLSQAVQQVRFLQEQSQDAINRLREAEDKLKAFGDRAKAGEVAPPPLPDTQILAQVNDVREVGGSLLVELSAGMNDGVQQNMQFVLHDGDLFLGNAQIIDVDENVSGARVTLLKQGVQADQIRAGVQAMTMAGP